MDFFDLPFSSINRGPFLWLAYGALAFAIPAYFLIATLILLDPRYRPA